MWQESQRSFQLVSDPKPYKFELCTHLAWIMNLSWEKDCTLVTNSIINSRWNLRHKLPMLVAFVAIFLLLLVLGERLMKTLNLQNTKGNHKQMISWQSTIFNAFSSIYINITGKQVSFIILPISKELRKAMNLLNNFLNKNKNKNKNTDFFTHE